MNEFDEKGVSNNRFFRGISDMLDSFPGFKGSRIRAQIHGLYHDYVATRKEKRGNPEGAKAERRRAQQQYERARSGVSCSDLD